MLVGYLFGEDTKALDWEHHQLPLDCPQCTYIPLGLHPSPDPTSYLDHYSSLPPLFLLILHQQFSEFTFLKNLHQGSSGGCAHCLHLSLLNPLMFHIHCYTVHSLCVQQHGGGGCNYMEDILLNRLCANCFQCHSSFTAHKIPINLVLPSFYR